MQAIPTQTIPTQPINTFPINPQPVTTTFTTQPVNTIPMGSQPINTISQPILANSRSANLQGSNVQQDFLDESVPIRSDFGKIKGLEVLTFKEAELERTLEGVTTFASVGNLQVLYFPNFDRFVLSLNDWKYPLLRRIPITAMGNNLGGPVQYTLPTYNGFYTLRLIKIAHLEALQNLESIFASNSKFSSSETENILGRGLSPNDRFKGQVEPTGDPYASSLGEIPSEMQTSTGGPTNLSRGGRFKRGFSKLSYKLTKGLSTKGKHNLNHLQVRDIDSIKRTSEITIPSHFYPRKEVERWITYAKEISTRNGYEPEIGSESEQLSPTFYENRMRGYGSVDLGQGSVSAPFTSQALSMGISSERPLTNRLQNSTSRTISGAHHSAVSYSKPTKMDKLKSKLPGTHHYHGEKCEGYTYDTHSNSTNPGIMNKVKTAIVGHEPYVHQSLAGPAGITGHQTVSTIGVPGIGTTQSVYTQGVPYYTQGNASYSGTPVYASGNPVYSGTNTPVYTTSTTYPNVIRSSAGTVQPETHHTGFVEKVKDAITGHHTGQTQATQNYVPTNTATSTIPTQLQQVQNNTATRIQNDFAGRVPIQQVQAVRTQDHLTHDQA